MKEELEKEQILSEKTKRKYERYNFIFGIFKFILVGFATVYGFLILQKPESDHKINREKTKLLLEILKEEDPKVRYKGIKLIKATYPKLNRIIDSIVSDMDEEAQIEAININQQEYQKLKNLKKQLEINHRNSNDILEKQIINNNIQMIELQISRIKKTINTLQN